MAKKTYKCLTAIDHDGKRYSEGDSIELDGAAEATLVELGRVEAPKAKEPGGKTEPVK